MDYLDRTNQALEFIESSLKDEITTGDVAFNSAFSLFHFHRIFLAITGQTIKEYIRKRRLTEAARELVESPKPIIDIALDYQFETQESFTKAFKKLFGKTPGRYRRERVHYDRLYQHRLTLGIDSAAGIDSFFFARIVVVPAFTVIGMRRRCTSAKSDNGIPEFWNSFNSRVRDIPNPADPAHRYGICMHVESDDAHEFDYVAAVGARSLDTVPPHMDAVRIAEQQYAVFTAKGVQNIIPVYTFFSGSWIKQHNYTWVNAPDFEFYDRRFDPAAPLESELDIYIPIK